MSVWNPPRLLDLAGKILLRDEASAITALEYLPAELFPPLFILAFYGASVALCPPASGGSDADASPGDCTSSAGWA